MRSLFAHFLIPLSLTRELIFFFILQRNVSGLVAADVIGLLLKRHWLLLLHMLLLLLVVGRVLHRVQLLALGRQEVVVLAAERSLVLAGQVLSETQMRAVLLVRDMLLVGLVVGVLWRRHEGGRRVLRGGR